MRSKRQKAIAEVAQGCAVWRGHLFVLRDAALDYLKVRRGVANLLHHGDEPFTVQRVSDEGTLVEEIRTVQVADQVQMALVPAQFVVAANRSFHRFPLHGTPWRHCRGHPKPWDLRYSQPASCSAL